MKIWSEQLAWAKRLSGAKRSQHNVPVKSELQGILSESRQKAVSRPSHQDERQSSLPAIHPSHGEAMKFVKHPDRRHLSLRGSRLNSRIGDQSRQSESRLDIINAAEPLRLSSVYLFQQSFFDSQLQLTVLICYLVTFLMLGNPLSRFCFFLIVFAIIFYLLSNHLESYRNFELVQNLLTTFSSGSNQLNSLICACLEHDPMQRDIEKKSLLYTEYLSEQVQVHKAQRIDFVGEQPDTFRWLNTIIAFCWPYLSTIVHKELNEFFETQIKNGTLANSKVGSKRLFYAIIKQLDTNISSIEHFQLGKQSPVINELRVFETSTPNLVDGKSLISKSALTRKYGKVLICDLDLHYNGDVNISVIYKYFCCCSSRFGLKDVFLHFRPRIMIGPIGKRSPFVDELAFTLLQLPKFGYKGIAMVELAELKMMRRMINSLIRNHILQPRVLIFQLGRAIESFLEGVEKTPRSRGKPRARCDVIKLAEQVKYHGGDASKSQQHEPPFWTRMAARLLLCSCICSNFLLRLFQNVEGQSNRETVLKALSPDDLRSIPLKGEQVERESLTGVKRLWPD